MNNNISPEAVYKLVTSDLFVTGINASQHQRFERIYAALDTVWRRWDNRQEIKKCAYSVSVD